MNLKEIKQIIDLMKRSDLTEFAVEEEGFKLRIKRGPNGTPMVAASTPLTNSAAPAEAAPAAAGTSVPRQISATDEPADEPGIAYIKSPMVGTAYRAPSPESPPFVDVNTRVEENTPVCIIEAMKIMNEIQAEVRGTVVEILVESGQPIEYGQRLFKVRVN